MNLARLYLLAVWACAALLLSSCGDNSSSSRSSTNPGPQDTGGNDAEPPGITVPDDIIPAKPTVPEDTNSAPLISGTAARQATVGEAWSFRPVISDADGDSLSVSARNLPGWLQIDNSSGRLSGTPEQGDVQTWTGIVLTVSDGSASASLGPFQIEVIPANVATGTATLNWLPPTMNIDGTPVGSIAGYRLLFGQESGDYSQTVNINNPGITTYMVEGLTSGTWYFAIQTVDSAGRISAPSGETSTAI